MLSGNSLTQTVHTHRASVHQAAKLVAVLLRVAGVTAGLAESNGSLPPGLWLTSPAGWLPRIGISSRTLCSPSIGFWSWSRFLAEHCSVIQYGPPIPFYIASQLVAVHTVAMPNHAYLLVIMWSFGDLLLNLEWQWLCLITDWQCHKPTQHANQYTTSAASALTIVTVKYCEN